MLSDGGATQDPFADLAQTAKDRARRSLLLEYQSRFKASPSNSTVGVSAAPLPLSSPASPSGAHLSHDNDDDDGFDPYHHGHGDHDDDEGEEDDIARRVADLHAQIDRHLLLRRQADTGAHAYAHARARPRASTLDHSSSFSDSHSGLPAGLKPLLRRADRPVSCPPLASNPFTSLSSALALSAACSKPATRSAPASSVPSPALSSASPRLSSSQAHDDWRPPLPNQWSANVLDDLDFLDTTALPVSTASASTDNLPGPSLSPATEAEDPLIRLARDTGPPSPTLSVMSSLAFELAGALGQDPPLIDPSPDGCPTSPTALEDEGDDYEDDTLDPRTVPLVAHRTVLDSDTVVTTYAYPQHTNAKRASYMSTAASAAAIARNSTLSSAGAATGGHGWSRCRTSSAMLGHSRTSLASDHRSSVLSSTSSSRRVSAAVARRSTAHSVRGSVFIDTEADVVVSSSTSVRGSFTEMRANMEMDVLDGPTSLALDSPDELDDEEDEDEAVNPVQAATRWSQRFSVPPNPFVDPDDDPLTNPAAWTNGDEELEEREQAAQRKTNASLDALAAIQDDPAVHQGTNHAMLRLMGIRDPPATSAAAAARLDGYDPDDPHAAILDPAELGMGLGASLSPGDDLGDSMGGGLSLEEELADAELKRFSTMLDRVASQIEDLRVADAKLTTSLEKVCARCRVIQTAGPGAREYLDPCSVHGMPAAAAAAAGVADQAPSR